ncbi:MAG: hypothetical protein ACTHMS_04095 [Jatrophihabitans sp.]|uniref:hypothetical protein n=1 Tax=Jatrophihabitans sp. TaxID=1932789 RepID=UPI003F7E0B70
MSTAAPAIGRFALARVARGAAAVAAVFATTTVVDAVAYVHTFPTADARRAAVSLTGSDTGLQVVFGSARHIDTVGGYVAYKGYVTLTVLGAVWALLRTVTLLRGDEETGRWQLLLTGRLRPAGATAATVTGMLTATGAIALVLAAATATTGQGASYGWGVGAAVFYAIATVLPMLAGVALGALAAQLAPTRRGAAMLGLAAVCGLFVVRMVADAGAHTAWLLWWTPFGWAERSWPFVRPDPRPTLLAFVVVAVLVGAACRLAARRDVGAAVLHRTEARPDAPQVTTVTALGLRLERPLVVSWATGVVLAGAALGAVSRVAVRPLPEGMRRVLHQLGGAAPTLDQFLGVCFLFVAVLVALVPAGLLGALADDERSGRLMLLVAQPLRRSAVLIDRLTLAVVAVVAAAALGGVGVWAGAVTAGERPHLMTLVGAGLNVAPTALVVLGVGAVALAVRARTAAPTVYGLVAVSFLLDLLGTAVPSCHWLRLGSVFHYMAAAPAQPARPLHYLLMLLAAAALLTGAVWLFRRRDLNTG